MAWRDALDQQGLGLCDEFPELRSLPPALEPMDGVFVLRRHPTLLFHADEAARCLASRRASAAMFHTGHLLRGALERIGGEPLEDWADLLSAASTNDRFTPPMRQSLGNIGRRGRATGLTPAEKYTEEEAEMLVVLTGYFLRLAFQPETP